MVVALVVSALVVVALVIAVVRLRTRIDELTRELGQLRSALDDALAEREAAAATADATARERDDALERVTRSRRDAAEVANRLAAVVESREAIEAELDATREALASTEAELAEVQTRSAAAVRDPGEDASAADALWALQLRQTAHTWRVSISLGPDDVCPLDDTDEPFRTAVEIEVDAAREEGGAAIDLVWGEEPVQPGPSAAALALALVRDVIATLGTTAGATVLRLEAEGDDVLVVVEARDDVGAPMAVDLPASLQVEPGVARIS